MEQILSTGYEDMIVITNRKLVRGDFLKQIEKVLLLSPKALILREKDLEDAAYEKLAVQVMALCDKAQVPCFLHSRMQLAKRLGCRCIHLPFALFMETVDPIRMSGSVSSYLLFDQISVSCHSLEEAKAAEEAGADQIVLGTIFETSCKPGRKGRGPEFVREVCEAVSIPVYAIGGVTTVNLPLLKEAGAAGGCMMSGFMCLKADFPLLS